MSPEQAEGKEIDHRTDIFSLGVVLYQMCTGSRPFEGDTNISTITAILRDTPPHVAELKPNLPNHLGRVIQRCLAKEPGRRYQAALEVRNELEELQRELDSGSGSRPDQVVPARTENPAWRRVVPWGAGVAAVVAIALWQLRGADPTIDAPDSPAPPVAPAEDRKTIVVFPFENLGPPEEAYFAAGITEEITTRLTRVGELGVMSRTSAVQYDRTGKNMQKIGEELGVDYVLEGTVRWEKRRDGTSRVRVTPQLVRTASDTHVWAQSYDRSMEEIFQVQSDIAEAVVGELDVTLRPDDQRILEDRSTENVDAWHAFQRGQEVFERGHDSPETHALALEMYERAVRLDPGFVRAHAAISQTHSAFSHWAWDRSAERLAKAKAAADRALALDPGSPWGWMALGYYHYWGKKEYAAALDAFGKAQPLLGEDVELSTAIANVYRRQGEFRPALENYRKAMALNPGSANSVHNVAETCRLVGESEACLRLADRMLALAPDRRWVYTTAAMWQLEAGNAQRARQILGSCPAPPQGDAELISTFYLEYILREWDRALELASSLSTELVDEQFHVESRSALAGAIHRQRGDGERARAAFEVARVALEQRVAESPENARARSALGIVYAALGRADDAVREGERAVEMYPRSVDAYIAPTRESDLALIHTWLGDTESALDLIEPLLEEGVALTPGWLRLDPSYDSLRDDPRFQRLVETTARS